MSDRSGEKAVKPKTDTGSESGSSDEVIETADDLQHLKLVKNEEQSEQSKEKSSQMEGTGSPIRQKISAEELSEAKPGTSQQGKQDTSEADSHSESMDISSVSSDARKSDLQQKEKSSGENIAGAKAGPQSKEYGKMPLKDVVKYFLQEGSVSRESTPLEEGNTLSDVSSIYTQVADISAEESVYHDAPSSLASESSVSQYCDARQSLRADSSDSTTVSDIPTLSTSVSNISTPTSQQGHGAYIRQLVREAEQRSDPPSTSSGYRSTNLSALDHAKDWFERGARAPIRMEGGEHPDRSGSEPLQGDPSSSDVSGPQGNYSYLENLEREARQLDEVARTSSDTSSGDQREMANLQEWMVAGKRVESESDGRKSSEQVVGDVEPSISGEGLDKRASSLTSQESDLSRSTSPGKRAKATEAEQQARVSEPVSSSSELDSEERLKMANMEKWLNAGKKTDFPLELETTQKHEEDASAKESSHSKAENITECSTDKITKGKKDEDSLLEREHHEMEKPDSKLSSFVKPKSISSSEFRRDLGRTTTSMDIDDNSKLGSSKKIWQKPGSLHDLRHETLPGIESTGDVPYESEESPNIEQRISKDSGMSPEQMEVGSPVAYELPKSTESDVLRKSVAARKSLSPSKTTERPESRLSRESSSSTDPVSTSASEFSRGLGSSTESMEPDEASLYRSTVRSDLRSGPTLRLQYGTTSYTKPIEEEMVTQFGIEGSSSTVEKGTFKDSGMSPEQMEVGSPVEHESLSASAKSDVSSKNEAPRKYLLSGRTSDEPESRISKESSSSAEPTSSTSDISRGPESPTESMGPNDTPRFGTATKALHESIHKHLMFATESIISPIREAITVFGTEESTDAEQKGLHESEKSPEQMNVGSPVECESLSEKSDIASKDLPSTAASASSESERSSAVVPTIKSEKQSSGSETIQDAATGESLSQIGKRCRMKAKLDKEKKSSRSDSSKLQKRARRHISGSPSESTEESTDSESNSETESAEKK